MAFLDFLTGGNDPFGERPIDMLAQQAAGSGAPGGLPPSSPAPSAPAAAPVAAPSNGGGGGIGDIGGSIGGGLSRIMSGQGLFGGKEDNSVDPTTGVPRSIERRANMQSLMQVGLTLIAAGQRMSNDQRAAILSGLPKVIGNQSDAMNNFAKTRLELAKLRLAERDQLVKERRTQALDSMTGLNFAGGGSGASAVGGVGSIPLTPGAAAVASAQRGNAAVAPVVGAPIPPVAGPTPISPVPAPESAPQAPTGVVPAAPAAPANPAAPAPDAMPSVGVPIAALPNRAMPAPPQGTAVRTAPPPPPVIPPFNPDRTALARSRVMLGDDKFGEHYVRLQEAHNSQEIATEPYQLPGTGKLVSDVYKNGQKIRTSPIADLSTELGAPEFDANTGKWRAPKLVGGKVTGYEDLGAQQAEIRDTVEKDGTTTREKVAAGRVLERTEVRNPDDEASRKLEFESVTKRGDELYKEYKTARDAPQTIKRINTLQKDIDAGKVIAGTGADAKRSVLRALSTAGFVNGDQVEKLATTSDLTSLLSMESGSFAKNFLGPQVSNADWLVAQQALGSALSNDPAEIKSALERFKRIARNKLDNYNEDAERHNTTLPERLSDSAKRRYQAQKIDTKELDEPAPGEVQGPPMPPRALPSAEEAAAELARRRAAAGR